MLVARSKAGSVSAAVVFLPEGTSDFGKHGGDRCYCEDMYGAIKPWGCKVSGLFYLLYVVAQLSRAFRFSLLTCSFFVSVTPFGTNKWFELWRAHVELAVQRSQRLQVTSRKAVTSPDESNN